jgi:hypothetical protein
LGFSGDRLFVSDYNAKTIYVLNPANGAVITSYVIAVPGLVGGGSFAGTRNSLFLTNANANTIYELDPTTGGVLNSFLAPAGSNPIYGLGFSSVRNSLFLGQYNPNTIREVNPNNGSVINSFSGPPGTFISALAADENVPPPVASASSNSPVCQDGTIQLYGGPTGMTSYNWYGPDGWTSTSTSENVSRSGATMAMAGDYLLSVFDGIHTSDNATTNVVVNHRPSVTCSAVPNPAFVNIPVTLSCTPSIGAPPYTYLWDFGDGGTGTNQNSGHVYMVAGTYNVHVTVTDSNGCTGSCSGDIGVVQTEGLSQSQTPGVSSSPPLGTHQLSPPTLGVQFVSVTPKQGYAGQQVTVVTNVVNTGDEAGNYNVTLKINGQVEQTRMVSVGPQGTQPVKFTVTKSQPGIYTVNIAGQQANFTILGAGSTSAAPVNGGLIAIFIVGILVIVVSALLILDFRRSAH